MGNLLAIAIFAYPVLILNYTENDYNCRTCELSMNDFLNGKMSGDELFHFLNHTLTCTACYEELETTYLLDNALERLENGESIDLARELKEKVEASRKALRIHRMLDGISTTIIYAGLIAALFALVEMILLYL